MKRIGLSVLALVLVLAAAFIAYRSVTSAEPGAVEAGRRNVSDVPEKESLFTPELAANDLTWDAPAASAGSKSIGDNSNAFATRNASNAASLGEFSKCSAVGESSRATSSGDSSNAVSAGKASAATSGGEHSDAAAAGERTTATSKGDYSNATAAGVSCAAKSMGDGSSVSAAGESCMATAVGDTSVATAAGPAASAACDTNGFACSVGIGGKVTGNTGSALAVGWKDKAGHNRVAVAYVGEGNIKAGVWYAVDDHGDFVEASK
jgi:hypothetical protein